jgi:ring-1,2-phenylacetyl-CoA epoxidase subunit PaaC
MQSGLDYLWPYVGEMFIDDQIDHAMSDAKIAPLPSTLRENWNVSVQRTMSHAYLSIPEGEFAHAGGRNGVRHTEHLGHMLAVMQTLQRSYPGATW